MRMFDQLVVNDSDYNSLKAYQKKSGLSKIGGESAQTYLLDSKNSY